MDKFKGQNSKVTIGIILLLIIILAGLLRLYQLGSNPPSLDWDEASLGYNAYSLLKTGKDEYGRSWPVSIRSFGDYKPAMYTYFSIPSVYIFGLNEFAVRLPSALIGTLTVLVTYFLVKELFGKKFGLITAFFLAISPWHLQFSRVAFESNVSLFFVFAGFWCFLKGVKRGVWLIPAALLLGLSFYTYHSPRLVAPLIALGWAWYFRKEMFIHFKAIFVATAVFIVVLIPFFQELRSGSARLTSVTVLNPVGRVDGAITRVESEGSSPLAKIIHNRRIVYFWAVARGYLDHFNLDFLFLTGDAPDRHHARDMGMLYLWEAPFIIIGMLQLARRKNGFLILWWYLAAPTASAITTGTPHAVRALLLLPTYQVFTTVGVLTAYAWLRQWNLKPVLRNAALTLGGLVILVNIFYYFQMYYVHTPVEASKDWQYGYKQAIAAIKPYEKDVNKIVITYAYDQPYIYVLFYNKVDPSWYQSQWGGGEILRSQRSFDKYEFRKIDWSRDQNLDSTLFIGTPGEIPAATTGYITDISFLDGTIAFRVVKR